MSRPKATMARLARRVHFSSGHRYFNPKFSEEDNRNIFGSCYSTHGHGHNYILEAYIEGEIHPDTGMVINLTEVDQILKSVTDPLDHQHLNFDVPYFKDVVPTTENVARYCFEAIEQSLSHRAKDLPQVKLFKVRLFEGDDLWVDYTTSNEVGL